MTHVRTSPYYPQSNGKIERWHKSLLNSAIGYITPKDVLAGHQQSFTATGTGSWQQLGGNGKFVGSKVPERISDCSAAKELLHSAVCASLLRASCCSL
jgi:hypothetical protein